MESKKLLNYDKIFHKAANHRQEGRRNRGALRKPQRFPRGIPDDGNVQQRGKEGVRAG